MPQSGDIAEADVLIVGAGPAGATAALALSSYGVRTVCLSKYSSTSATPRAHITNQRTMEILRHFGLEDQAMAVATPHDLMGDHVFCTSLAGFELGRIKAWHTHPSFQAQHDLISPCSMVDLTQDLLEPVLVGGAMRAGSHVRFDTEMLDFTQDDNGVIARVFDRVTGATSTICARYLIGADGANSRVAEHLGLAFEGKTGLAANIGIAFKADLERFMSHRAGVLYWLIQPGRGVGGYPIAGLRMIRAWNRWITTWGYPVNGGPPKLSNEEAIAIVHRAIGDDTVPVEIETVYTWTMNRVRATAYGKGRVFCMGDAVHRHPPMNGLGSNTSIQDAFNLAWKLAMVIRGEAGQGLLDSYEAERMPIGHEVVRRAADNFGIFGPVGEALGFKPGEQSPEQFENLAAQLTDPSPAGKDRRAALRAGIDGHIVGASALGGEHNQLYRSNAVIEDVRPLEVVDPEMNVIMGVEAGRRLPHAWLTKHQRRVSTLDACAPGVFTLLTGVAGSFWVDAAAQVGSRRGLTIRVQKIGPGQEFEDAYGDFGRLCLPDETGAVLVRPDLYVAWRVDSEPESPVRSLDMALAVCLSLPVDRAVERQAVAT